MAFLAKWFWSAMEWLGLTAPKNSKILVLGLDNAGKTTMLRLLHEGNVTSNLPTGMPYSEEVVLPNNVRVKAFDMGGQIAARKVWKGYFPGVDGIVFMIDSTDTERMAESRKELQGLLSNEELHGVPVVVFGNKIDLRGALSESELRLRMGLIHTTGKEVTSSADLDDMRPVELFMSSVLLQAGLKEGMEWFSKILRSRK